MYPSPCLKELRHFARLKRSLRLLGSALLASRKASWDFASKFFKLVKTERLVIAVCQIDVYPSYDFLERYSLKDKNKAPIVGELNTIE